MSAFPLRHGDARDYRLLREFLDSSDYTDANAAERIGHTRLDNISRYDLMDLAKREHGLKAQDVLGTVSRFFLCGSWISPQEAAEKIPAEVFAAMDALGLVEPFENGFLCPVLLYPFCGLYLASDRFVNADGSEHQVGEDFVFLPLQRTATDFMASIPGSPCGTFLDLGTGAGGAALWAAKNCAGHAWGIDVAERPVHFAEFNRRLNGIENATFLKGDLYEPVRGMQFDRIATHPPYSIRVKEFVYAYGGEDGEALTRRIMAGLPEFLKPGGILACWTIATDRREAPLERRVRGMIGAQGEEFDVAALVHELQDPDTYAMTAISNNGGPLSELTNWRAHFQKLGVVGLCYGSILVRRHKDAGQQPSTARRTRTEQTPRPAAEWLLDWESAAAQSSIVDLLAGSHPRICEGAELVVRHQVRDETLIPVEYELRAKHPFITSLRCPAWLAFLFSRCDGKRSGHELFEELQPKLPAGATHAHCAQALAALVGGAFVEISEFPIPANHP